MWPDAQPISSAPTDGTRILAWGTRRLYNADLPMSWGIVRWNGQSAWWDDHNVPMRVACWLPLPPAPQMETE